MKFLHVRDAAGQPLPHGTLLRLNMSMPGWTQLETSSYKSQNLAPEYTGTMSLAPGDIVVITAKVMTNLPGVYEGVGTCRVTIGAPEQGRTDGYPKGV
jgi:hypothetical protein